MLPTASGFHTALQRKRVDVRRNEFRRSIFSSLLRLLCLLPLVLSGNLLSTKAAPSTANRIVCRPELSASHRRELVEKLRRITGWQDLDFDADGKLIMNRAGFSGGSQTARELLSAAAGGETMIVLEEASDRSDVVFCRVVEGRWKNGADGKPPVYVVLIDFADFAHVLGDRDALAAFNVGWGLLHELDHVVNDTYDPARATTGEAGNCEALVNRMRRECGLAERADYFYTYEPGSRASAFKTKLVRLAFDQRQTATGKTKRHWIIWDASIVGGLPEPERVAALR
ncbi:MAG: hypothetical protein WCD76_06185 [Pyrinomonadaceae bacterium]